MAVTSTSFKKSAPGKPKGAKHPQTLLKEKLGLTTWETMGEWLLNEGLDRYKLEMEKLKGKDFIFAHNTLVEYFKPKLNRTTHEGTISTKTHITVEL